MTPNKPLKDWEIEFDKKFGNYDNSMFNVWKIGNAETSEKTYAQLKDFIQNVIDQTKSQIVEQILGMESEHWEPKYEITTDYGRGYVEGMKDMEIIIKQKLRLQIKEELLKIK